MPRLRANFDHGPNPRARRDFARPPAQQGISADALRYIGPPARLGHEVGSARVFGELCQVRARRIVRLESQQKRAPDRNEGLPIVWVDFQWVRFDAPGREVDDLEGSTVDDDRLSLLETSFYGFFEVPARC